MSKKTSFQEWYEKNREEFNEMRRKKYEQDEEHREKMKKSARQYYWMKKRRAERVGDAEPQDISWEELFEIVDGYDDTEEIVIGDVNDIRHGKTVEVPVFYLGSVAKLMERTVQTIKFWFWKTKEDEGLIEDFVMRTKSNYRTLTVHQMLVLARWKHYLKLNVQNFGQHPFFLKVKFDWMDLEPHGLKPMLADHWREVDKPCKWCGNTPKLQVNDEDVGWADVPCLDCCVDEFSSIRVKNRMEPKKVLVTGRCHSCNSFVSKSVVDKDNLVVICPFCDSRLRNFEKEE